MAKILRMFTGSKGFLESARRKGDEGRTIDAISDYYASLKANPNNVAAIRELAEAFEEIGCMDQAKRTYKRLLVRRRGTSAAYDGLIACAVALGDVNVAEYYYRLGTESGALNEKNFPADEYFDADYGDDALAPDREPVSPRFRICESESERAISLAHGLAISGETDMAVNLYESVDARSQRYDEARAGIIFTLCSAGRFEDCVNECDAYLKRRKKKDSRYRSILATKMLALSSLGRNDEFEDVADELDALGADESSDVIALATAYVRSGHDYYTLKYFEKLLTLKPYDRDALLIVAQAEFNLGMSEEAEEDMVTLQKLYPGDAAATYYAKLIKRGGDERVNFAMELPDEAFAELENGVRSRMVALSDLDEVEKALVSDPDFERELFEIFNNRESFLLVSAAQFLCQSDRWRPFVRDRLLEPDLSLTAKRSILSAYLRCSTDDEFEIAIGDLIVPLRKQKPNVRDDELSRAAYWQAVPVLAYANIGFDELGEAYVKTVEALEANKIYDCDPSDLAAYLLHETKISEFGNLETCCKSVGAKTKNVVELAKRLGNPIELPAEKNENVNESENVNEEKEN